jgi:hypothetical protein
MSLKWSLLMNRKLEKNQRSDRTTGCSFIRMRREGKNNLKNDYQTSKEKVKE